MKDTGVPLAVQRIARGLFPPDHPVYQPCKPPVTPFGLMASIDTAWSCGYERGFHDALMCVTPKVIIRRVVTKTPSADADAMIAYVRQLADAVALARAGKSKLLVDYDQTVTTFFEEMINWLGQLPSDSDAEIVKENDTSSSHGTEP